MFRRRFLSPRGLPAARRRALMVELQHHLDQRIESLMTEGYTRREAIREAHRRFGNVEQILAICESIDHRRERAMRRTEFMHSTLQDIRYGIRTLRAHPGFAAAVVVTLGLGIGATTAIFTVVDATLWRPLPFDRPEALVEVQSYDATRDWGRRYMFLEQAIRWREQPGIGADLAMWGPQSTARTDGSEPRALAGVVVSSNLFATLGVAPRLGRGIGPDDTRPGAMPVVVLAYQLWVDSFGASPTVVGRDIRLEQTTYTIIGVMPKRFRFPQFGRGDLWIPLRDDGVPVGRQAAVAGVGLIARARDQLSIDGLQTRLDLVSSRLERAEPHPSSWSVRVQPLDSFRQNPDMRQALGVIAGAVAIMLLIAVANAANLLLVRGTARARGMAIRRALGASRGRLVRHLLTESLILASLAGGMAMLTAIVGVDALVAVVPRELVFFSVNEITVETRVLTFTAVLAVGTGIAFGTVPALIVTRPRSTAIWHSSARVGASPSSRRIRHGIVVAEVALSVALLIGAALFGRSFVNLVTVDMGFNPNQLVLMTVNLSATRYASGESRYVFFESVREHAGRHASIQSVTVADGPPPSSGFYVPVSLEAEGHPPPPPTDQPYLLPYVQTDDAFLKTLEITLLAGGNLALDPTRQDHVLIDRGLARLLWGTASPVGRRFRVRSDSPWLTVTGVVDDLRLEGPDDQRSRFAVLHPLPVTTRRGYLSVVARASGRPEAAASALREAVYAVDPHQPIAELQTGREALAGAVETPRFVLVLMTVFATLALILSAVGLYGVLAFSVQTRARELGIRAALGARADSLRGLVLWDGVALTAMGIAIGLAASVALSTTVRGLLFGVGPNDPMVLAAVSLAMLATAFAASYIPAWRATRVDPIRVLRVE